MAFFLLLASLVSLYVLNIRLAASLVWGFRLFEFTLPITFFLTQSIPLVVLHLK